MLDIIIGHESFASITEKYNEMHCGLEDYLPDIRRDENGNANEFDDANNNKMHPETRDQEENNSREISNRKKTIWSMLHFHGSWYREKA